MATRGQTHNKRAREMALREKRERKQAKKDQRAAGLLPVDGEGGFETSIETDEDATADPEQTEPVAEATQ